MRAPGLEFLTDESSMAEMAAPIAALYSEIAALPRGLARMLGEAEVARWQTMLDAGQAVYLLNLEARKKGAG